MASMLSSGGCLVRLRIEAIDGRTRFQLLISSRYQSRMCAGYPLLRLYQSTNPAAAMRRHRFECRQAEGDEQWPNMTV